MVSEGLGCLLWWSDWFGQWRKAVSIVDFALSRACGTGAQWVGDELDKWIIMWAACSKFALLVVRGWARHPSEVSSNLKDSLINFFLILWESPHRMRLDGDKSSSVSVSVRRAPKPYSKTSTWLPRQGEPGDGIWTNKWASLVHHVLARSPDWYHFNTSILVLLGFELRMCASKNGLFSKWSIFPYLTLILTLFLSSPTLTHLC